MDRGFTALSLQSPGKVRFRYFLEGHDRKWNELEGGRERVASYTNLPPGSYTFRVKACNNDGLWNEAGAEVGFYLAPHFYQTFWFYGACACLLVLATIGIITLRVKSLTARKMQLAWVATAGRR